MQLKDIQVINNNFEKRIVELETKLNDIIKNSDTINKNSNSVDKGETVKDDFEHLIINI